MSIIGRDLRNLRFLIYFERFLSFFVSTSAFLALNSAFLLFFSFIIQGILVDSVLLLTAFTLTFALYNFDRLVGQEEDLVNDPEKRFFLTKLGKPWVVVAVCSLLFSFATGLTRGFDVVLTLFVSLLTLVLYSFGFPFLTRFKNILGVKNVVVAATWAFVATSLPNFSVFFVSRKTSLTLLTSVFYFIFIKLFINTVIFDVRDVEGDSAAGLRTLPLVLGINGARKLLYLVNMSLFPWLLVSWFYLSFSWMHLLVLIFSIFYGFLYIHFFVKEVPPQRIFFDLFIDGEWLLTGLLAFLLFSFLGCQS